jgi:DNA-binding MarR family transcriptional regulator
MLSLVGGLKGHRNVLSRMSLLELKSGPTDHLRGRVVRVTLQAEEVAEEVEMGRDVEVRLAEIDEDGDVNKGVRVEIA